MNRLLRFLVETPLLRGIRSSIGSLVVRAIEAKGGTIVYYREPHRKQLLDRFRAIYADTKVLLLEVEAVQLAEAAHAAARIPGDMAEVGTYRGGSTSLIAEAVPDKHLHTFDTFEGLPPVADFDASRFATGQYATSEDAVRAYLSRYPNVTVYTGLFPDTAGPIADTRFSFVHLDVDLYEGTLAGLAFFYPRMNRGALLISHDYANAEGVRRAFDEFFADKPEAVVPLAGSQCLVVKV